MLAAAAPSSLLLGTLLVVVLGAAASAEAAPAYPDQREGDFVARDFRFQSGDVLPEVRLHYTTLGRPARDPAGRVTNAVLLLHGTTGTGKSFLQPSLAGELFGPGQVLDASRWFVILPDGLGRGGSSKPSDGLHARFPRYGYLDVVAAQRLLVAHLGVDHLRAVLGTSMGGMQTWLWGERYPEMMDALMPIASQPIQISGRNLLWRRIVTEAIRADPDWNGGEYRTLPRRWQKVLPLFAIMTESAARLQAKAPTRAAAGKLYDELAEAGGRDANDSVSGFESSWDSDPEPELGRIQARLVAVNFADDLINPADLGVMERVVPKVKNGSFVIVPVSDRTMGHMTLAQAAVWKPHLESLLRATQR